MLKNILFVSSFLFSIVIFSQEFPKTKTTPETITKFGTSLPDNYSWLEGMNTSETKNWVESQNKFTNDHLEEIKKEYNILSKIKEYDYLSNNNLPTKKGKYYYSRYRKDKEKPSSLYYRKKLNDFAIELINPFKIYNDNSVYLDGYSPSKNSKFIAYNISVNGSDNQEIRFINIDKNENLEDIIKNVKFSTSAWNEDYGIFYKKNNNLSTFAKDSTNQLYYHKIGNKQEQDELIYDASKTGNKFNYFTYKDKLILIESSKEKKYKTYYSASLNSGDYSLVKFLENEDADIELLHYAKNRIYFSTKEYDWGEIRSFEIGKRKEETVIIPQIYQNLLVNTRFIDDFIVCTYKTVGKNYIIVYGADGHFIKKFEAPYGMDFNVKFYDDLSKNLLVTLYSRVLSAQNFKLNIETGESSPYYNDYIVPKTTIFPLDYFVTKSITYKSRDGIDVPITIIHKKGLKLDGNNPTLLEAYGGFGVVSSPNYDTGLLCFLEKGGVYAFSEIRGGGEKGLNWHKEGMGLKKMNSFNDFIDASEFLIKEKYTSSNKLAISGGSNGGLVVGVAMIQRPDLFKVVIPKMGAFDMIKYDQFTVGEYHLKEYGNPNNKTEFESLLKYSPYHNIKEDVNYPITLLITSENDDRVPPLHSYKFAARLQNRSAQKNPIYLKILSNSGHYGKISNYQNNVEEEAAFYNFILFHLNQ